MDNMLCAGCIEGRVKLVNGGSMLEGRVEFCKDSQWGTICHNSWDHHDARVVCRQLGYAAVGNYLHAMNIRNKYVDWY